MWVTVHSAEEIKTDSPLSYTRRYASAVFALVVCPSVRPSVHLSVTSRYYIERTGQIELVLAPSTYPNYISLCNKEIRVPQNISVLPFRTSFRTLDIENLATESRSCCRQNSPTVELDGRRVMAART